MPEQPPQRSQVPTALASDTIMQRRLDNSTPTHLAIVLSSIFMVTLLFQWQGNKGFSLWDEGYLWYGAQRVMLGEVPILDFAAYDPARYYWSAALMHLLGSNGIMSLRIAVAVFQCAGLFVGLLTIRTAMAGAQRCQTPYLLLAALVLATWMFPRHKLFDISLSLFLLGLLTYLASAPSNRRYFLTGLGVGAIALFGRNHGVYGAAASLAVVLWFSLSTRRIAIVAQALASWVLGVAVGFSPMALMAALVPGFATAFWDSVMFLFEFGATNLPLPVPWPWTVPVQALQPDQALRGVLVGLFFMGTLVFGMLAIAWAIRLRRRPQAVPPALVACGALALPYAHYAFSRADVGHLAQGIFPLLVGCLAWLAARAPRIRWTFAALLCAASLATMASYHPGWQCRAATACVDTEIAGHTLRIDPETAQAVRLLREMDTRYTPAAEPFIAAPFWPGAYALLQRRSPLWEIYAVVPRSPAFEEAEIERLVQARPRFAVVFDLALDGREELRYRNTHPLLYSYIQENFDRVPYPQVPSYEIYVAR